MRQIISLLSHLKTIERYWPGRQVLVEDVTVRLKCWLGFELQNLTVSPQ